MSANMTYIIGCGGHGRVLLDVLRSVVPPASMRQVRFLDDREALWGSTVDDVEVAGGRQLVTAADKLYLGIGDNATRRDAFLAFRDMGCEFPVLIAPTAVVSSNAIIGDGTVVLHGAIVQTGASIAEGVIVNSAVVVEHDCVVGAHVHLAPRVVLSGGTTVGEGTLIDTGAAINRNIEVGEHCVIESGAAVVHDIPPHSIYRIDPRIRTVDRNPPGDGR